MVNLHGRRFGGWFGMRILSTYGTTTKRNMALWY